MARKFFVLIYEKLSCAILGFILISAIPVAFGLAQNWFIPLASGYQISFFMLQKF